MKKISIVIPAYNEEKRIGRTLNSYSDFFNKFKNKLDYEIIVVINNTNDRTEDIVNNIRVKNKKIKCLNFKKGGKGFAVLEGFKESLKGNNNLIGFVDADMATSPDAFYELIKQINNYDGVIASRYIRGAIVKPKPKFQRLIVSRMFNFVIRVMFLMPYRDTQCGAKLFKRYALEKVLQDLGMSKWAFDVELLYNLRKNKYKIKEIPTNWADQEYSKINFLKAGPFMVLAIIRLRILNSAFKKFIRIYDKFVSKLIKI